MRVLAEIVYTDPSGSKRRWSRLQPLYRADEGRWVPIQDEAARRLQFPQEGLVFWWDSPAAAEEEGWLWLVELEEDPRKKDGDKDKFRVARGNRPEQFELSSAADSVELRRLAAGEEIILQKPPAGRVLIRLPDDPKCWVGPMKFTRPSGTKTYRGPTNIHTGFLDLFEIEEDALQELSFGPDGVRTVRVLVPNRSLEGCAAGHWAAQDDQHLLHGLIKRFQHLDESAKEGMDLTDRAVRSYLDTFEELDLLEEDAKRERARNQAVSELLAEVELNREALEKAEEALLAHPRLRNRIDETVAETRRERLDELESEIEELTRERKEAIRELDSTLELRRSELEETTAALARLESDTRERLKEITRKLVEDPVTELADNLVVNAIVDALRPGGRTAGSRQRVEIEPEGESIEKLERLRSAAEVGARHLGLHPQVSLAALATVLDGRPILTFGSGARNLCRLVGNLTCAGLVWEVSVPTGIFGLNDLLDLPAVRASRSSPSILQVGEVLDLTAESEQVHTILFKGINRAPLEVGFEELVPDWRRGTSSASMAWRRNDEYLLLRRTSNVILMGTLSSGPSCFSVAPDLAAKVGLVDADRRLSAGDPSLPRPRASLTATTRDSLRHQAVETGQTLGTTTSFVEEPEDEELKLWAGVFGDPLTGAVEWLMTRASHRVLDGTYREGLPSEIARALDDDSRPATIERLRMQLDLDNS